jgi:hypothetical protein
LSLQYIEIKVRVGDELARGVCGLGVDGSQRLGESRYVAAKERFA